jgi:transposase
MLVSLPHRCGHGQSDSALPSYSPELNAIERLWLYLRERYLSHGVWPAYPDIVDACCRAWNAVRAEDGRIRSLCSLDWAQSVRI